MQASLVPVPQRVELGDGRFRLTGATGSHWAPEVIAGWLRERTGLPLDDGETSLRFGLGWEGPPESYRLTITSDGVQVEAADDAGLYYAGCTLEQLLDHGPDGWALPTGVIQDAPRFGHRGMMLDVARHFFDVATVKRLIDQLARLKLNVLHLHLSDDQGWRLEIRSRPGLTGQPGEGYYRRAEYADLVEYAAARQVTIVPEIDLPGHTHAVGLAYPGLVEPPVLNQRTLANIQGTDGVIPEAGRPFHGMGVGFSSLRIDHEPTYEFVADVLGELAELTPGRYLHIGGDECLGTPPEAFAGFLRRVTGIVAGLGKTPIAWHEAGAVPGIAAGTVGQYWGFLTPDDDADDSARRLVDAGSRLILSPADAMYLDMHHEPGEHPGLDWANGPTGLPHSYDWEPTGLIPGVDEAEILGVEAALWTEQVTTPAEIDALVFPRLAAVAEIAWSAPAGTPGRNWPEFRSRVAGLAPGWRAQGIGFTPVPEVEWVAG
ncbi:MAG: family 20 glycosylhydrolase [Propionicimonas sp.]